MARLDIALGRRRHWKRAATVAALVSCPLALVLYCAAHGDGKDAASGSHADASQDAGAGSFVLNGALEASAFDSTPHIIALAEQPAPAAAATTRLPRPNCEPRRRAGVRIAEVAAAGAVVDAAPAAVWASSSDVAVAAAPSGGSLRIYSQYDGELPIGALVLLDDDSDGGGGGWLPPGDDPPDDDPPGDDPPGGSAPVPEPSGRLLFFAGLVSLARKLRGARSARA